MTGLNDFYYDLKAPILDIGTREGWTGYIDFITWDEVPESLMKGKDRIGRKFIVAKFTVGERQIMQTFFQRYSRSEGWMGCGHATINLFDTSGGMSEEQLDFLKKIFSYEKVKMIDAIRPCCESFIDQEVELLNLERIEAAKVIQKAWLKCRYNPKYTMCHRVQNRNLDLICEGNN